MNTSTRHSVAIEKLCKERRLSRGDFRQTVRRLLCCEVPEDDGAPAPPDGVPVWDDVADFLLMRPDAYKIINGELHCYEIVDTSGMTDAKRGVYALAWFAFDSFNCRLRLFVGDLYGNVHEYDLAKWLYGLKCSSPQTNSDE
jgi:hypothetical protein